MIGRSGLCPGGASLIVSIVGFKALLQLYGQPPIGRRGCAGLLAGSIASILAGSMLVSWLVVC